MLKLRTYKFRPIRRVAKVIAKSLQQESRKNVEIAEILPNVYIVNIIGETTKGFKDCPQFLEYKVPKNGQ